MRHRITLANPTQTADGDGGYTETWTSLSPPVAWASVKAARGRFGEAPQAGTVEARATHQVSMRYHPDVTVKTRVTFTDRAGSTRHLSVIDVSDVEEQGTELVLTCVEVTTS